MVDGQDEKRLVVVQVVDCNCNLCTPLAQGNEGRLYEGTCRQHQQQQQQLVVQMHEQTTTTSAVLPVVLKSVKRRVGSLLRHEIASGHIMSGMSPALQLYAAGWNFLLLSHLQGYQILPHAKEDATDRSRYVAKDSIKPEPF